MVATRNHPKDFESPEPTPSPTKRTTRASTTTMNENSGLPSKAAVPPSALMKSRSTASAGAASKRSESTWSHTPSNLVLIWHAIGLPLVIWDTGYVLLRPYSMPGGALHWPLWAPYALYGRVDWSYGLEAWQTGYGWTTAQATVNALETLSYLAYLYIVYAYGQQEETQGRGAPKKSSLGRLSALGESRTVYGEMATYAVLIGYTVSQITFWKTVLYCKRSTVSHTARIRLTDLCRANRAIFRLAWHRPQRLPQLAVPLDHTEVYTLHKYTH